MTKEFTMAELVELRFEMMNSAYSDSGAVYATAGKIYADAVASSQFSNADVSRAFYHR